jgi:hypothetical protein
MEFGQDNLSELVTQINQAWALFIQARNAHSSATKLAFQTRATRQATAAAQDNQQRHATTGLLGQQALAYALGDE